MVLYGSDAVGWCIGYVLCCSAVVVLYVLYLPFVLESSSSRVASIGGISSVTAVVTLLCRRWYFYFVVKMIESHVPLSPSCPSLLFSSLPFSLPPSCFSPLLLPSLSSHSSSHLLTNPPFLSIHLRVPIHSSPSIHHLGRFRHRGNGLRSGMWIPAPPLRL